MVKQREASLTTLGSSIRTAIDIKQVKDFNDVVSLLMQVKRACNLVANALGVVDGMIGNLSEISANITPTVAVVENGTAGPVGATGLQGPPGPAGPPGHVGPESAKTMIYSNDLASRAVDSRICNPATCMIDQSSLPVFTFGSTKPEGFGFVLEVPKNTNSIFMRMTGRPVLPLSKDISYAYFKLWYRPINGQAEWSALELAPVAIGPNPHNPWLFPEFVRQYKLCKPAMIQQQAYHFMVARHPDMTADTLREDFNVLSLKVDFVSR